MAAEAAAQTGAEVDIFDRMPSPARKFLMAGKSGLNITKIADGFAETYGCDRLGPMLAAFGPAEIRAWMDGLGQPSFVGSTGRVFPDAMKASPLLRAWLARLDNAGVTLHRRTHWTGWDGAALTFDNAPNVHADACILAMGGASWRRLGSNGAWAKLDGLRGHVASFAPSNVGLSVPWSQHMERHFGAPLKNIQLSAADTSSRGEVVLTRHGLEGGALYPLSPALRQGAQLTIDLKPDLTDAQVRDRLTPRGKASLTNHLRKALRLTPVQIALLREAAQPLPADLTALIKCLPIPAIGLRPMDEAISTAGGLRWDALDENLMLRHRPGIFAAGEMLDWEAPTGGYLLTACLATGAWAGRAAARYSAR